MSDRRMLLITAALAVAGATFGGVAGATFGLILQLMSPAPGMDVFALMFLGTLGAIYGFVLGPIGAWVVMREVPLGRAVVGTTVGAVAGGMVALLPGLGWSIFIAPAVGFFVAANLLRRHARRRLARDARAVAPRSTGIDAVQGALMAVTDPFHSSDQ